jgi:uracil-DNA glycosylase family 4
MYLLVDGNSLLWRAAYRSGEANVAVTFVSLLDQVLEQVKPQGLLVCWDMGRSRRRLALYPEYKATRVKKDIDVKLVYEQADLLRSYFKALSIQQFAVDGVEADDLISWISEYIASVEDVVILTSDRDLWALVSDRIQILDSVKNVWVQTADVLAHWHVLPKYIPHIKAIVGDSSDNIKGIKGLGDAAALQFFERCPDFWSLFEPENVEFFSKSKKFVKLYMSEDLERDFLLTKLPTLKDLPWYISDRERDSLKQQFVVPARDDLFVQAMCSRLGRLNIMSNPIDFRNMNVDPPIDRIFNDWAELDSAIYGCSKCPLRSDCGQYGPTLASGFSTASIMLVGRNPGHQELIDGKPFVGASGGLIDDFLTECSLTRDDVYITNVCKCYSENNRMLELNEIMTCKEYLQAEINLLKPKLIVAFGNEAMSLLTPYTTGISRHCGEILDHPKDTIVLHDAFVALCVHPSSALRHQKFKANFDYATKTVASFLEKRRG